MEIVSATSNFDFSTATLADPQPLTGQAGFYFTQLGVGSENKSLCLQLPECLTKQGVVNIKNGKYLDMMFERDNHDELMKWVEKLEYTCQDIIDSKKELWFQTELTRDDIETMMSQITRLYQSGKYVLMRVFIDVNKNGQKCIAYDENEKGFDLDILEANKSIIPLVMIEGVKFSSRSFEISLKLVQVMVMGKYDNKSACLIRRPDILEKTQTVQTPTVQTPTVQTPIVQAPIVQAPIVQKVHNPRVHPQTVQPSIVPKVQTPILQKVQAPTVQPSIVPKVQAPTVQAPTVQTPTVQTPTVQKVQPILKSAIKPTSSNIIPNRTAKISVGENKVVENNMEEININYQDLSESITLKNPNEVYYEIYKNAREKAKECRIKAIEAYLEAKQIKTKYMLDDLDDSDDSDDENYTEEFE
jgi:hypothetical protein